MITQNSTEFNLFRLSKKTQQTISLHFPGDLVLLTSTGKFPMETDTKSNSLRLGGRLFGFLIACTQFIALGFQQTSFPLASACLFTCLILIQSTVNPPQPPPLASTFWSTSAGNSSLVLPFDPVLEDPVAVEHHTLVAGE